MLNQGGWVTGDLGNNLELAISMYEAEGVSATVDWACAHGRAYAALGGKLVVLNPKHRFWRDPCLVAGESWAKGWLSTSDPAGVVYHEVAHAYDRFHLQQLMRQKPSNCESWVDPVKQSIALQVSGYAGANSIEFVAETYSALRSGRAFGPEIMRLYRQETGREP